MEPPKSGLTENDACSTKPGLRAFWIGESGGAGRRGRFHRQTPSRFPAATICYLADASDFRQSANSCNTSCRVQRSRYAARARKP